MKSIKRRSGVASTMQKAVAAGLLAIGISACGNKEVREVAVAKTIPVKVETIGLSSENHSRNYVGTVEESFSLGLSFSGSGTVESVHVTEGQQVSKGQLLAVLNSATAQNSVSVADATLVQAEDAYERMKKMHDSGALPDIKWVEVETGVQKARAMKSIAQKQLADTKLYAPRNGIIATRSIEPGANVMPGAAAFKLITIDKVEVKIAVPENEIGTTATGQAAFIEVPALNGATFNGKITTKGVAANAISHTYEVRIAIDNSQMQLMPGMVCKVQLNAENQTAGIVIPSPCVQKSHDGKCFVWLADGNTAKRRFVQPGEMTNQGVEIISGLSVGEQLIVEGGAKVSEGMKISIL